MEFFRFKTLHFKYIMPTAFMFIYPYDFYRYFVPTGRLEKQPQVAFKNRINVTHYSICKFYSHPINMSIMKKTIAKKAKK